MSKPTRNRKLSISKSSGTASELITYHSEL
jgi:hypothetical protein